MDIQGRSSEEGQEENEKRKKNIVALSEKDRLVNIANKKGTPSLE